MGFLKEVKRLYKMEDRDMLVKAQVFHNNYENDKQKFEDAFTHFGPSFAADFQTAIDTADAFPFSDGDGYDLMEVSDKNYFTAENFTCDSEESAAE